MRLSFQAVLAFFLALVPASLLAQQGSLAALGAPANPRVVITWDRYYDHATLGDAAAD